MSKSELDPRDAFVQEQLRRVENQERPSKNYPGKEKLTKLHRQQLNVAWNKYRKGKYPKTGTFAAENRDKILRPGSQRHSEPKPSDMYEVKDDGDY